MDIQLLSERYKPKFLIVDTSPLPILEPKYSLQDSVFKSLSLKSSFNVRYYVSQPYSKSSNTIVLYILILKFIELENTEVRIRTE